MTWSKRLVMWTSVVVLALGCEARGEAQDIGTIKQPLEAVEPPPAVSGFDKTGQDEVNLFDGSFSYSVPLDIPAGGHVLMFPW